MNGDNENENGMEEADKLSSGSSEVLDAEQKHASEADTLPIDGQVQVPKPAKNGFWSHLESKSSPILVSENPLPSNPTKKDLFLHAIRCPPHGKLAKILTLTLVIVSLWATCLGMLGEVAQPPNGTIFILIILVVVALFFGWIFSLVRLPPLLGMLLTGILIKNIPGMTFDTYWTKTSSILRGVALVVILMRAGLGLDPQALKRLSVMVFRLAFTPCLAETLTVAVASHFLLNFPWIWGFMLGFVLAAVSPAVVVPCLLGLQERGYGVDKGIPTLVIAAASVDDVLAISGFTILLGITFKPTQDILTVVFQGPKEVVIGLLFGIAWAGLSVMLPGKDDTMMGKLRFVMVFLGGLLAYFGSKSLHLDGAGALAVLVMAFVAGIGWRKRGWSNENAVTSTLSDLWVVFQPILFGLIGTEIRVDELDSKTVGYGLAVLAIGITIRIIFSYVAVLGGDLTLKERIFVALAWLPKATVQAALGPVALDSLYNSDLDPESELYQTRNTLGLQVLTIAVLVILITAPIGSVAITLMGPRLLNKTETTEETKKDADEQA